MNSLEKEMMNLSIRAKKASRVIYSSSGKTRNRALTLAAALLEKKKGMVLSANEKDLAAARRAGLSSAIIDRLTLDEVRIAKMKKALLEISRQSDPIGAKYEGRIRPNGLRIEKVRVPIGVILIIYESRPNVTLDSAALCIKAGNAVILRGGKEAVHSNRALAALFRTALTGAGLPADGVQMVGTTDRTALPILLHQSESIDLAIPRGGEALIRAVTENTWIPVLKHYKGVCHVYIDRFADPGMAEKIAVNAKVQRPGVCNAAETLLLDKGLSKKTAGAILSALWKQGVKLKGCSKSRFLFTKMDRISDSDYHTEYLDLIMNVKVVDGVEGAAVHIAQYGSAHTDTIVTKNKKRADLFIASVDSASVMWNVSTRFSDGGEYGLGAEIGISTDKLHARGPMGAFDLTTYKWVVQGTGQLRN